MDESRVDRTLILGAGPAGLSAAHKLSSANAPVEVFESDPLCVGGLAKTVVYKGNRFDIGGHRFFTKSAIVEQFWRDLLGEELLSRPRRSRIFFRQRFLRYPLQLSDVVLQLGIGFGISSALSYLWARCQPSREDKSFEDWIVNRFGRKLFDSFFKTYTEKVWGLPCDEISADWAAQRIKGLSVTSVLKSMLLGASSGAVIKTLIHEFLYPRLGPGQLWEEVARRVIDQGGSVRLGHRVDEIHDLGADGFSLKVTRTDGSSEMVHGHQVVSSIPLGNLIPALRPLPPVQVLDAAAQLRYRDFVAVVLILDTPFVFPDQWIYVHDPRVSVARIQNTKNWSSDLVADQTQTVLIMEYFCGVEDAFWNQDNGKLVESAADELALLNLAPGANVVDGTVLRVPHAYPVYDEVYRQSLQTLRGYLAERHPNLQTIGRNGMHRYNNQDHATMTGFLAAENILAKSRAADPWRVNEDGMYLEEQYSTETCLPDRLVPQRIAAGGSK